MADLQKAFSTEKEVSKQCHLRMQSANKTLRFSPFTYPRDKNYRAEGSE
jgi:hypothetical protein